MEKFFKLKERKTSVRTEFFAGLTTFMTMAYILAVNPNILSASGMDSGAVFTATALASALASFLMGLIANLPFVLSAGMGLNAYFAFTVCQIMGYSWQVALAAVFAEGIIFIFLSILNVREAIFNMIPASIKVAVSVGIGLFIAFIGMQNAHIVVNNDSTLLSIFSIKGSLTGGTFNYEGITVLLALIGCIITGILVVKNVKGNILIGIFVTWLLGIICQLAGLYVPNPDAGFYSLIPSAVVSMPTSMAPTFMKLDFSAMLKPDFIVVVIAFLFVDMFDTLGTLIGCGVPLCRHVRYARNTDRLRDTRRYAGSGRKAPGHQGRAPLRRCRYSGRFHDGNIHDHYIRRVFFRYHGRRTHGSDSYFRRSVLRHCAVLLTDLPDDSVLCDGTGSDHRRLHDDAVRQQDCMV